MRIFARLFILLVAVSLPLLSLPRPAAAIDPAVTLTAPADNTRVSGSTTLRADTQGAIQGVAFSQRRVGSLTRTPNVAIPDAYTAMGGAMIVPGELEDAGSITTLATIAEASLSLDLSHPGDLNNIELVTPDGMHVPVPWTNDGPATYDLSAELAGKMMAGTWSLYISDWTPNWGFDEGNLAAWSLNLGAAWTSIGNGTQNPANVWTAPWNTTSLPLGTYQIRALATHATSTVADINNVTVIGPYSISGRIATGAGTGLHGVLLSLSGSTVTASTNSNGDFTLTDLRAGTYTLTPAKAGYSFTPVNRSVTITSANVIGQNFTGIPTPTVTGLTPALGVVGTIVTITGSNLSGATVVKFNTTNAPFTVNSATQITATVPAGATTGKVSVTTLGGTARSTTYFIVDNTAPTSVTITTPADGSLVSSLPLIKGSATDNVGGSGINRVSVTLLRPRSGGGYEYWNNTTSLWQGTKVSRNATLSAPNALSTNWVINSGLPSGAMLNSGPYFLTASAYDNAGLSTSIGTKRFTVDSTAPTVTITTPADGSLVSSLPLIKGSATDNIGGSGINRVSVTLLRPRSGGGYQYWNSATSLWQDTVVSRNATLSSPNALSTIWSLSSGLPSGTNLPVGIYFLTAYVYDNAGRSAFSGTKRFTVPVPVPTYSISGRVVNSAGVGVANVNVKRTGSTVAVLTNATGYYTLANVPAGSYTITPSLPGVSFTPVSRTVSLTTANATNANFISSG